MSEILDGRVVFLERLVNERAEAVKRALKEYREAMTSESSRPDAAARRRGIEKRIQDCNAEYVKVRRELDLIRGEIQRLS